MNFQFVYENYLSPNPGYYSTQYHTTDFLIDWLPYDLTYWRSNSLSIDLPFGIAYSGTLEGLYIFIEHDNWDSFDIVASNASVSGTLSYNETIQDNFRILEITSAPSGVMNTLTFSITNSSDYPEAGQIILTNIYELEENPDINFQEDYATKTLSSYRSSKNILMRNSIGTYKKYDLKWTTINDSTREKIDEIFLNVNEHPIIFNLGDLDSDWRWAGLTSDMKRTRVVASYWNIELSLEDLIGEA